MSKIVDKVSLTLTPHQTVHFLSCSDGSLIVESVERKAILKPGQDQAEERHSFTLSIMERKALQSALSLGGLM